MLTINNTLDGYLKDVEIKGNTIQDAENLADIRSVGDTVEGQELYEIPVLSCGKNLFNGILEVGDIGAAGEVIATTNATRTPFIPIKKGINYVISDNHISSSSWIKIMHYDINKKFIATKYSIDSTVDGFVRVVKHNPNQEQWKLQLEEGTVATPYEPYQEDKLTILSPTQLEKVGDVADRIIEKDGVWGVEKNVFEHTFNGSEWWQEGAEGDTTTGITMYATFSKGISNMPVISPNLQSITPSAHQGKTDFVIIRTNVVVINIDRSKLNSKTFTEWLKENNILIKYATKTPQFIPLPHSQQVKLRTFANKTNISFLTEIEGTIKAQVPKSLGATVNTNTCTINSLNKEVEYLRNYIVFQNRLMLASRYNADTVSFKVDVATLRNSFEYDNDLYELILNNILVGKDNYNRDYIENLIIFYWMDFVISDEMHSTLFEIIEEQHNPKIIEEETPLI